MFFRPANLEAKESKNSFELFESCDKENNAKIQALFMEKKISFEDMQLIKKIANAAHERIDEVLSNLDEKFESEAIKEKLPMHFDKVLTGKKKAIRATLEAICISITQRVYGRYHTSLTNGYCPYSGRKFVEPCKVSGVATLKKSVSSKKLN